MVPAARPSVRPPHSPLRPPNRGGISILMQPGERTDERATPPPPSLLGDCKMTAAVAVGRSVLKKGRKRRKLEKREGAAARERK